MPPREEPPRWLTEALSTRAGSAMAFPEEGEWFAAPEPGEIRVARPMDEDADVPPRLILVLEADTAGDPWVSAALLAETPDVATDKDLHLGPRETGLPFPVLVETDMLGPLFVVQLGPVLGRVDAETADQIRSETVGRRTELFAGRRGLPVLSRADARWRWKDRELEVMHALAYPCMEVELGGRESLTLIDPTLTEVEPGIEQADRARALVRALAAHEGSPRSLAFVVEDVWSGEGLEAWVALLPPDAWRAFEPALTATLSTEASARGEREAAWEPDWPTGGTALAREIARRAAQGRRAVRVITHHAVGSRFQHGGTIALRVRGVGLVQVKPEGQEEGTA